MATPTPSRIRGISIKGDLTAAEDLTLDCAFEGSINLKGHELVAGTESRVNASVAARVVTVHGQLQGHITADVVDIASTALVDASVIAGKLAMEDGARFNGPVNTERARAAGEVARHRLEQGR